MQGRREDEQMHHFQFLSSWVGNLKPFKGLIEPSMLERANPAGTVYSAPKILKPAQPAKSPDVASFTEHTLKHKWVLGT